MYRTSLFSGSHPESLDDDFKKIRDYVMNDSLYKDGMGSVFLMEVYYRAAGLPTPIYCGIGRLGEDLYNYLGYSADPLRDHVKTMADRIVLY